jgi:DNA-binding GntR family transcriptional regulator
MIDVNTQLSAIVKKGSIETIHSLDKAFHRKIYRHCDNSLANEIYERYRKLILSLRRKHGFGPGRLSDIVEQHQHIIEVLPRKDESVTSELIRKHRKGAMEDLLDSIRSKLG